MAEFEDKLQAILGDPEAMGQIASLAQALSGGQGGEAAPADGAAAKQPESGAPPSGEDAAPDLSTLLGALSGGDSPLAGLDPQLLQTGLRLYAEYSAGDDRKAALLSALRPFVKPERYARLDQAVRIARLARVIRVAFRLFRDRGKEDADV